MTTTEYAWIYTGPGGPISARIQDPNVPWDQEWYLEGRDDLVIGGACCARGGYPDENIPNGWEPIETVRDGAAVYRRTITR